MGREKFPINGKIECCLVQIADEMEIALSVVDAIESVAYNSILTICSRISYATEAIHKGWDAKVEQTMSLFKRFSLLAYEYQERILTDSNLHSLYMSFANVVKNWFMAVMLQDKRIHLPGNYIDSINADLQTLEMALGVCVISHVEESDLDDLFF